MLFTLEMLKGAMMISYPTTAKFAIPALDWREKLHS